MTIRLWVLAIAIAFAFASSASAQMVRVINENAQLSQQCVNGVCYSVRVSDHGSGVVVGREGGRSYVLTAAHVVRATSRNLRVHQQPATILAVDAQLDVALLEVACEFRGCAEIGCADVGSAVTLSGYAGTDVLSHASGRLTSMTSVNVVARDGDSGGAVMANGQLVGLITSVGSDYTRCTSGTSLQAFVLRSRPSCFCGGSKLTPTPSVMPVAIAPAPPAEHLRDVPDLEKVRRIAMLESEIALLKTKLAAITTGERGLPGRDGSSGKDGRNGLDGKNGTDGRDAVLKPLTVRLDHVDPSGNETKGSPMTYAPGELIVIKYRETKGK